MTTYHLVVNIDEQILQTLVAGGYSLCFATNVGNQYNVVALAVPSTKLTFANEITWTTSYTMAATTQAFQAGNVVEQGKAPTLTVEFGQEYDLKSWSEPPVVNSSPSVPSNALGLQTGQGVDAAAVISLHIPEVSSTEPAPIYISPIEIPLSTSTYTPIVKIALWFQQNLESSTMIVLSTSQTHVMDFTNQKTRTTTYHNDGTWTDGSGLRFDYTRLKPAYVGKRIRC